MGKRVPPIDVLGEVRRAMRVLRRVEKFMRQQERDERRKGIKVKARAEATRVTKKEMPDHAI